MRVRRTIRAEGVRRIGTRGTNTEFWWEKPKEGVHLEEIGLGRG
jgi:hypothetical protein